MTRAWIDADRRSLAMNYFDNSFVSKIIVIDETVYVKVVNKVETQNG
jgi:hypothetical protein